MDTRTIPPEKQEDETMLEAIRKALDEGEASGVFEGDAFESVCEKMGWSPECL